MKFDIEISEEIYLSYNQYIKKKMQIKIEENNVVAILGNLMWILVILFLYSTYRFYSENCCSSYKNLNLALILLGLTLFMYYFWYRCYLKLYTKNQVFNDGTILGTWEIEIDDNGIYERKQKCYSFFKWKCITSIESDEINLYLFLDSVKAIILPKNQIPSGFEMHVQLFKDAIKK